MNRETKKCLQKIAKLKKYTERFHSQLCLFWKETRQPPSDLSLERASCNQQNNAINYNFRQASSKHLEPKAYLFFSKLLSKINGFQALADFLSRLTVFSLKAELIAAIFEKYLVHMTLRTIPHWLRYGRAPTNCLGLPHTSRQGPTRRFEI